MDGAQAFLRGLRLLKTVAEAEPNGIRLSHAADRVGISRPTARRLLSALVVEGFVDQTRAGGLYVLGHSALTISSVGSASVDWEDIARDTCQRLAQLSQDVVLFAIRSGRRTLIVSRVEGEFPVRTHVARVGDRHPPGVGVAWISMLSLMRDEQVDALLDDNDLRLSDFANFSDARVRELVAEARETGYALNRGLIFKGAWAMGVPVVDPRGRPVAAISIAAVEERLSEERRGELLVHLREEASVITNKIGAM